jgi:hypothetical protein
MTAPGAPPGLAVMIFCDDLFKYANVMEQRASAATAEMST